MTTFTAMTDAVGGSVALSALVGTIPLLTFFVMLLGVKARAHVSGATALLAAIVVAVLAFGMPLSLALLYATRARSTACSPSCGSWSWRCGSTR